MKYKFLFLIGLAIFILGCTGKEAKGLFAFVNDSATTQLTVDSNEEGYIPLSFTNTGSSTLQIDSITSSDSSFLFLLKEDLTQMIYFPVVLGVDETFNFFSYYFENSYNKEADFTISYKSIDGEKFSEAILNVKTNPKVSVGDIAQESGVLFYQPSNLKILFGNVYAGLSDSYQLAFKNNGGEPIKIENITFQRGIYFSWEETPSFPIVLAGNEKNEELVLIFSPSDAISYSDLITFETEKSTFSITVEGVGLINNRPSLSLEMDKVTILNGGDYHFGYKTVDENASIQLDIVNTGRKNLEILEIVSSDGIYNFSETNFIVAPNARRSIDIDFTFAEEKEYVNYISILSNDPDFPSYLFSLKGEGISALKPRLRLSGNEVSFADDDAYLIDFPLVDPNVKVAAEINFINDGSSDLTITSIATLASPFAWEGEAPVFPLVVAEDEMKTFSISFVASEEKKYLLELLIVSNHLGIDDTSLLLKLRGEVSLEKPLLKPEINSVNLNTDLTPHYQIDNENVKFTVETPIGSSGVGEFKYSVKNDIVNSYIYSERMISVGSDNRAIVDLALNDGLYTLEVQEKAVTGEWSAFSSYSFEVDRTIPVAPILNSSVSAEYKIVPLEGKFWANSTIATWSWIHGGEASEVQGWRYRLNGSPDSSEGWTEVDILTVSVELDGLGQGEQYFYLQAKDKFGRFGLVAQDSLWIDTLPPSITYTGSLTLTQEVNNLSGVYNDPGFTATDAGIGYDASSARMNWITDTCTGRFIGVYEFKYQISDKLGNSVTSNQVRRITINDTTAPSISVGDSLKNDGIEIAFGGTASFQATTTQLESTIQNQSGISISDNSGGTVESGALTIKMGTVGNIYKAGKQKIFFAVKDASGNYSGWDYFVLQMPNPQLDGNGNNLLTDSGFENCDQGKHADDDTKRYPLLSSTWSVNPLAAALKNNSSSQWLEKQNIKTDSPQGGVYCYNDSDKVYGRQVRMFAAPVSATNGFYYMSYQAHYIASPPSGPVPARNGTKSYIIRNTGHDVYGAVMNNVWVRGVSVDLRNTVNLKRGFKYNARIYYRSGSQGNKYGLRVGIYDNSSVLAKMVVAGSEKTSWTEVRTGETGYIGKSGAYTLSITNFMNSGATSEQNTNNGWYYSYMHYDDASLWCTGYDTHESLTSQNPPSQQPSSFSL